MGSLPTAVVFLLSLPLAGQSLDERAIRFAKTIPVSRLEAGMPRQPFAAWFQKLVGPLAKVTWETNDCGEQTGSPADAQRDFPICAEAGTALADGRKVIVQIAVGTFQKGISGRPVVWWAAIDDHGSTEHVRRLRDMAAALKR
jgi:hypothetical protein